MTADDFASKNNSPISLISSFTMFVLPQIFAVTAAGASNCTAYRSVVFAPTSPNISKASSSTYAIQDINIITIILVYRDVIKL